MDTDVLVDELNSTLNMPSYRSEHRSRYAEHTFASNSLNRSTRSLATERAYTPHREYLYNKYGKFGGKCLTQFCHAAICRRFRHQAR